MQYYHHCASGVYLIHIVEVQVGETYINVNNPCENEFASITLMVGLNTRVIKKKFGNVIKNRFLYLFMIYLLLGRGSEALVALPSRGQVSVTSKQQDL